MRTQKLLSTLLLLISALAVLTACSGGSGDDATANIQKQAPSTGTMPGKKPMSRGGAGTAAGGGAKAPGGGGGAAGQ